MLTISQNYYKIPVLAGNISFCSQKCCFEASFGCKYWFLQPEMMFKERSPN